MRILSLLSAFVLWMVSGATLAQPQAQPQAQPAKPHPQETGAGSACAGCHRAQTTFQQQTPMGRALILPETNAMLKAHPKLTYRKGPYSYTVETRDGKSTYSVTDGERTVSLPIHWSFGAGVQAWIMERDGKYVESLVSYYPATNALDITIGDESLTPHNLDEAVGRPLTIGDLKECFGCHSTNAVANGQLNFESLSPGVTCERCHANAGTHLWDSFRGDFDSAPPNLGKLSTEDLSNFCGQCHRTWETVIRNRWRGEANVRFQPYRLANSKCYDGADPRIGCLACHDPHQDVVHQETSYDSKCLACHAPASSASAHPSSIATNTSAKACPVAKSACVSCHMPKVKLPDEHVTFTDHQIRVVKAGDPYPN